MGEHHHPFNSPSYRSYTPFALSEDGALKVLRSSKYSLLTSTEEGRKESGKLSNLGYYPLKGLRLVFGETGKDFTVQFDAFQFERVDKLTVGESERASGGVDADVPEGAEVGFFVLAMREGILARMNIRLPRGALFLGASEAIALDLFQESAPEFESVYGFLNPRHIFYLQ